MVKFWMGIEGKWLKREDGGWRYKNFEYDLKVGWFDD